MILKNPKSMENENLIFHVNEDDFVDKVIEKSENTAVLVDFWAPWCEPCKQLTPVLEETIKEAGGMICLAKINIDENKQLASQLKIQSIPTVIAFHKKQIANGFQGVLPKTKIIEFIEKITGKSFPQNKEQFYKKIKDLIKNNNLDIAINEIEHFLSENSDDVEAMSLYIECFSISKKFKEGKDFINSLSKEITSNQNIKKSINKFKMLETSSKEPSIEILLLKHNEQPNDIENLQKLCDKYFFEKQYTQAFELLIKNYLKLKEKNKEEIKKILLKYFDALGDNHEQTKIYRRKLSSLLFS